jgi:putative hemolysin
MKIAIALVINDIIILIAYSIYLYVKRRKKKNAAENEIISMVNESSTQGYIEENEAQMITNIFGFGDMAAKDCMTDRSNIVGIDASLKLSDALEIMLNTGSSRFPVYEEDLDRIIGILYLKDAMRYSRIKGNSSKKVDSIDGMLREARFIPETLKLDTLFQRMQSLKLHMVIVIDEYGQTAGLIAMEDILEEIVGNIQDEYDEDDGHIVERGEGKYIVEGVTSLEELEEKLGIEFHEENFETINGYLISKMEKIPDKKVRFDTDVGNYNFKVLEVDNNMVRQVLVTKINNEYRTEDKNE